MSALREQRLTRRNKVGRLAWSMVYWTVYRWSPAPLHGWRAWLLRRFGATVGRAVLVYPSARIWAPWNLTLGDRSCLGRSVDCYCVDEIVIGEGAIVSQRAFLCGASHDASRLDLPLVAAPIRIERHAWVTSECFVAPGVTLHEGAVALARSVVLRDVPAWTVVGGHPARPLRERRLVEVHARVR